MKTTKDMVRGAGRLGTLFTLAAVIVTPTAAHPSAHTTVPVPAAASTIPAAASTAGDTVLAFHAALARGDTDGVLAILAENALIFESGGIERSRAEYAAHHLKADAAFSAAVRRNLVDRSSSEDGDTAWVMSVETVTGSYKNRTINIRSVETIVLRRLDTEWRIVHIHWSSADI